MIRVCRKVETERGRYSRMLHGYSMTISTTNKINIIDKTYYLELVTSLVILTVI